MFACPLGAGRQTQKPAAAEYSGVPHVVSHSVARTSGQQAKVILYGAVRHHGKFIANLKSEICNMKFPLYEFAGLTNGALKMTRRLRMAISQKLASLKGSAEDAKAGKNKIGVNLCNPQLIKDLQVRKFTYEIIKLFLQNEPNFRKTK